MQMHMDSNTAGAARATWLVGTITQIQYVAHTSDTPVEQVAEAWLHSLEYAITNGAHQR